MDWTRHLLIVPILLPLVAGAALLLINETRHTLKALVSLISALLLLVGGMALMRIAAGAPDGTGTLSTTYAVADWPAPFAIVLVLDRLSALMLVLTSVVALASLTFSLARWHGAGPHFHSLFQFLLMGLGGAFLTGDLFNLFVFFEVTLAASYGLLLHGSGAFRVRSGLHYIAINLAASLLFLLGVATLSPEAEARTIIVAGFSKTYAMTGWRIGTTVAPLPIAKAIAELQSQMSSNVTSFAQFGALAALKEKEKTAAALKIMLSAFDRRRKYLHAALNAIPGVTCQLAQGAFYLFPNISSFGLKDVDFCNRLLDTEKVAAVPGSAFGAEGYLRLSYATSDEIIAKGVERLTRFCATLKK